MILLYWDATFFEVWASENVQSLSEKFWNFLFYMMSLGEADMHDT